MIRTLTIKVDTDQIQLSQVIGALEFSSGVTIANIKDEEPERTASRKGTITRFRSPDGVTSREQIMLLVKDGPIHFAKAQAEFTKKGYAENTFNTALNDLKGQQKIVIIDGIIRAKAAND